MSAPDLKLSYQLVLVGKASKETVVLRRWENITG